MKYILLLHFYDTYQTYNTAQKNSSQHKSLNTKKNINVCLILNPIMFITRRQIGSWDVGELVATGCEDQVK